MDDFQRTLVYRNEIKAQNIKVAALEAEVARLRKDPIKTNVLDHGYVELYDWMGDDLRIVNMARQSFGQESVEMGEAEGGLIQYLMREHHGTPFEGPVFTFNVKCPIFVAREWFRHRISSYNEYSGRYSKMINQFYVPSTDQIRSQVGKPGRYRFEKLSDETGWAVQSLIKVTNGACWKAYETMLGMGVAKEVARLVLPVNIYTQFTWVVNLRSLLNFVSLRSDETAMWEIRQYSKAMESQIQTVIPHTYEAFIHAARVAP